MPTMPTATTEQTAKCPNGHADPIYVDPITAECAVCGTRYNAETGEAITTLAEVFDPAELARVFDPAEVGEAYTVAELKPSMIAAAHVRGRMRAVVVSKVGRKNATVECTTPTAIEEAHARAGINREAGIDAGIRHSLAQAARYDATAAVVERLGIATEHAGENGRPGWVDHRALPAEFRAVEEAPNNVSKQTIVYEPATYRRWAESSREQAITLEGRRAAAAEWDALPYAERVRRSINVTAKTVPATAIYRLPR